MPANCSPLTKSMLASGMESVNSRETEGRFARVTDYKTVQILEEQASLRF